MSVPRVVRGLRSGRRGRPRATAPASCAASHWRRSRRSDWGSRPTSVRPVARLAVTATQWVPSLEPGDVHASGRCRDAREPIEVGDRAADRDQHVIRGQRVARGPGCAPTSTRPASNVRVAVTGRSLTVTVTVPVPSACDAIRQREIRRPGRPATRRRRPRSARCPRDRGPRGRWRRPRRRPPADRPGPKRPRSPPPACRRRSACTGSVFERRSVKTGTRTRTLDRLDVDRDRASARSASTGIRSTSWLTSMPDASTRRAPGPRSRCSTTDWGPVTVAVVAVDDRLADVEARRDRARARRGSGRSSMPTRSRRDDDRAGARSRGPGSADPRRRP